MTEETIRTICWTVTFIFAIQGATTYLVVRMLVMGNLFPRRVPQPVTRADFGA